MNFNQELVFLSLAVAAAVGCSSTESDSAEGGGGQTSSTTGSATTGGMTSSSSAQSSSTGIDLEAECAARTPPDCGNALETGCLHVSGYRFDGASGACTTPDVPCDTAEEVDHCLFAAPGTPYMQASLLIHRNVGGMTEVLYLGAWPTPGYTGWTMSCYEAPACAGWEEL